MRFMGRRGRLATSIARFHARRNSPSDIRHPPKRSSTALGDRWKVKNVTKSALARRPAHPPAAAPSDRNITRACEVPMSHEIPIIQAGKRGMLRHLPPCIKKSPAKAGHDVS
jgi:hypothetical protein